MSQDIIRVLIVEDSAVQRKILRTVLEQDPAIHVVGHASNGELALDRLENSEVDVVTLDLEMPVLGGLGVLEALRNNGKRLGVIVVSALSRQGAQASLEAMRLGAFDFITKPAGERDFERIVQGLGEALLPRIHACAESSYTPRAVPAPPTEPRAPLPGRSDLTNRLGVVGRPDLVVLGCSTGGPQALDQVIPALPADLGVPVLIVQHMPPMFTRTLAESLDRKSPLEVQEATDGQEVRAGQVLIAPGGKQMRVLRRGARTVVQLTDDPPERSCRPSVDYLFRSAAEVSCEATLAVVLTGMGDDGTIGCRQLKQAGARVVAQDEASCVVFGMPRLLVEEGIADVVVSIEQIAPTIIEACGASALK